MTRFLRTLALFFLMSGSVSAETCSVVDWPLWKAFQSYFIQESGRVLDASTGVQHSSSEGQSYAMFFALVANDPETFDRLWRWSVDNLGDGDLSRQLPAWIWGQADDKTWQVLDENSASDADLWFAYALLEAGRLWGRPDYTHAAKKLITLIVEQEVINLPGMGAMLLPGRTGFVMSETSWRLNPSYLPVSLLRRLESVSSDGLWDEIAINTGKMLAESAPSGVAADWIVYDATDRTEPQFVIDPDKEAIGSYDAIRTYLWAGMTPATDPLAASVLESLAGMLTITREQGNGIPPELVDTQTAEATGRGSFGFSAALAPYFKTLEEQALMRLQTDRVESMLRYTLSPENVKRVQPPYYDFVLSMFGMGWMDGLYRFNSDGTLYLPWERTCLDVTTE